MKLLIILLCLGLERFLHAGNYLCRFNWFSWYLEKLPKFLGGKTIWRNYLEVVIVVLPLLVITSILYCVGGYWLHGWFKLITGTILLLYSLGPEGVFQHRDAVVQNFFSQMNQRLLAVLFWFVLLGPVAAVLYRAVALLKQTSLQANYANLAKPADTLLSIFDWIPVRFFGLLFAFVGNFVRTFGYWIDTLFTGWSKNHDLIESCGRLAQGLEIDTQLTAETKSAAEGLTDRALIVFIVAVAAFTLGAWL